MALTDRNQRAYALLGILATVPMFVFDIVDYKVWGEYRLHPLLVEQLLTKRGQYDGTLSIKENIAKHYGEHAAELAESLI